MKTEKTYYVCSCGDQASVHFFTPQVGFVDEDSLELKGQLVSRDERHSIELADLVTNEVIARVSLSLAEDLKKQNPTIEGHFYRFRIIIDIEHTQKTDKHFKLSACDISGNNALVAVGFIQPTEKVDNVVFVVGSPRSGTTAVGKALRKGLAAKAHGESHVVEGIGLMLRQAEQFFLHSRTAVVSNNLVNIVPASMLLAEHIKMLRSLYQLYYGTQVHLDKTPGIPMLEHLPLVFVAWPNAKVIFCKRRVLENVASRLIKFPKVSFEAHVKQWKQSFVTWRQSRQQISQLLKRHDWFREVEQKQLSDYPQICCDELSQFLGLNVAQTKRVMKSFTQDKPEQTSGGQRQSKALHEYPWSEHQKQFLLEKCEQELRNQGYSLDSHYYQ